MAVSKRHLPAYPTITLKAARDNREEAKRLLANGIDPSMQRRLEKQITSTENTFRAVAEEVLAKMEKEGRSDATLTKKRWLLDFAYPTLGDRPIAEITAPEVLRYSLAVASRRSKATMRPPAFRG